MSADFRSGPPPSRFNDKEFKPRRNCKLARFDEALTVSVSMFLGSEEEIRSFQIPPMLDSSPHQTTTFDALDDVFGSAPSSPTTTTTPRIALEPSEVPRIQSEHSTAGYRDGLTSGKALHIQAGFDEGYALSTLIGLRVGEILGVLEGLYSYTLKTRGTQNEGEQEVDRMKQLCLKARKELKTEEVFAKEFWDENGIWKFDVGDEEEEEKGKEVLFEHVAEAHPKLKTWRKIMQEEVDRCGLHIGVLEGVNDGVDD